MTQIKLGRRNRAASRRITGTLSQQFGATQNYFRATDGFDHPVVSELGQLSADGLDRQTKAFGDIAALHWQVESAHAVPLGTNTLCHVEQENGKPLGSGLASQGDDLFATATE